MTDVGSNITINNAYTSNPIYTGKDKSIMASELSNYNIHITF